MENLSKEDEDFYKLLFGNKKTKPDESNKHEVEVVTDENALNRYVGFMITPKEERVANTLMLMLASNISKRTKQPYLQNRSLSGFAKKAFFAYAQMLLVELYPLCKKPLQEQINKLLEETEKFNGVVELIEERERKKTADVVYANVRARLKEEDKDKDEMEEGV